MSMEHGGETTDRRERKRAERTEALLERAMTLAAAEGLEAVTLQRLAAEADYVPAALYRYFPSKDALLAAMQRRAVKRLHEGLAAALGEWDRDAARRTPAVRALGGLFVCARFYLGLPSAASDAWVLVASLLGDPRPRIDPAEAMHTMPLLGALLEDVRARFAAAQEAGALEPGEEPARVLCFWTALHGAAQLHKLQRFGAGLPTVEDLGLESAQTLLRGWGAEPRQLSAALRATGAPASKGAEQ